MMIIVDGMQQDEVLYHGSQLQGMKVLEPNEAGFGIAGVYATDSIVPAVIFLGRKRNSMQATWSLNTDKPFFCERAEGVFDKWYSGVSGSVYVLAKRDFQADERLFKHEFVSLKPVKVLEEIKVADAKAFLMSMEHEGKLKIVRYSERWKLFPNDDDLIEMCVNGLKKYSMEFTLKRIRQLQPSLEEGFIRKVEQEKRKIKS
jgi:hypothetical protein